MSVLQGKRIFYIEDDVKNRSIAQVIIEQSGAKMGFERWGGAEALVRLKAFMPVDLILLDLMFPHNITGYDIFRAIRSDSTFDRIPVVIVSASDPAIEIPIARARGLDGFISKPIDLRWFPQQIATILTGQPVWSSG
jgi:CheY-like chemotaxis protein